MESKSDIRSSRRASRVSATQASRSFSRLLDEVEAGRRFVVHRHGREVCEMVPRRAEGRRASEVLAMLRARPPVLLDDRFSEDLLAVVAGETVEERPPWGS